MQGALLPDLYGRSRLASVGFGGSNGKPAWNRRTISRETSDIRRSESIVVVELARVKLAVGS
jgi:hypothetical protein